MANGLSTVTETYQGNSIQCAQFVIDTISSLFRCEPLDVNGSYAFQMVAKADGAKSIQVFVGDKSHTFNLTTSWAFYSFVFEDVTVNNSFLQFKFLSNGTYKLYHSKLEHGNKITDWDESDYDIRSYAEQTADRLSWIVASGTSASNFTLTSRTAELIANDINLNGRVSFTGLDSDLQNNFDYDSTEHKTYINGGNIKTDSIEARMIKSNETFTQHLTAQNLDITGGTINVDTSSEGDSVISLNYEHSEPGVGEYEWHTIMRPSGVDVNNIEDNTEWTCETLGEGIFFNRKDNNVVTAYSSFGYESLFIDDGSYEMSMQNGGITCKNKSNDDYCEVGDDGIRVFTNNDEDFVTINPTGGSITNNDGGFVFLNQYNTVAGKITGLTVPANGTVTSQIVIPTDRVGFNKPVVTATSNDPDCFAYIVGITTANNQHTITLGLRNITATALSNKAIHYIITRYDT